MSPTPTAVPSPTELNFSTGTVLVGNAAQRLAALPDNSVDSVVCDPFGGTGTVALVAKALGRHGVSVDMSADYCRLATWRTTDPGQLAKAAMQVKKPAKKVKPGDGQPQLDFGGA